MIDFNDAVQGLAFYLAVAIVLVVFYWLFSDPEK